MRRTRRQCLKCGFTAEVVDKELDAGKEVTDCLKCKGAFVDTWSILKYLPVNKTNREDENKPLLIIELENENSYPKVIYKGKNVSYLINFSLDYQAGTSEEIDGLSYAIQHFNQDTEQVERLERKLRGHVD